MIRGIAKTIIISVGGGNAYDKKATEVINLYSQGRKHVQWKQWLCLSINYLTNIFFTYLIVFLYHESNSELLNNQ